jgi:thiamine biosynthesis protein ThiS
VNVVVNGENKPLLEHKTLSDALVAWGYQLDMPMAIAVNYTIIPNSTYSAVELKEQDIIEILMPMQGG